MRSPPWGRYQVRGVRFIERHRGRAIIGDDMGLGKTWQAIAWSAIRPEVRPIVVVCPAPMKYKWQQEFRKHAGMDSQILEGCKPYGVMYLEWPHPFRTGTPKERKKWFSTERQRNTFVKKMNPTTHELTGSRTRKHPPIEKQIVILSYAVLQDWVDVLRAWNPSLLIVDECHYIKEPTTIRTKKCKILAQHSPHMLALSGTPIKNRPREFYPVLNMVAPGAFPSFWRYAMRYCDPRRGYGGHWDFNGSSNLEELYLKVSRHMIRRMKEAVLADLPEQMISTIPVQISNRKEYVRARDDFLRWVEENGGPEAVGRAKKAVALVRMTKLKHLAVKGKIRSITQWIDDWLQESEGKLVVFGIHRDILASLRAGHKKAAFIDGSTSTASRKGGPSDRDMEVEKFWNDNKCRVLFGNIEAAGIGIDLTPASSVLNVELDWVPANHDQANDRVRRIGQRAKKVNVYYMVAKDTIEERIIDVQLDKRHTTGTVLDGKGIIRSLIEEAGWERKRTRR